MNETEVQAQLGKIDQAIVAQEALRGVVAEEQIEPTLSQLRQKKVELVAQLAQAQRTASQADLSGGGAIAQGPGATAVGERSVYVGGSVSGSIITGDNVTFYGGSTPAPLPAELAPLRDQLLRTFNLAELNGLCFDLGIDFESLAGQTRPEKAQSLVAYCDRHNRMDELLARVRALRPHVEWDEGKA